MKPQLAVEFPIDLVYVFTVNLVPILPVFYTSHELMQLITLAENEP